MREWLKELRVSKGLTLAEAGEALDMSESYYKRIEDGDRQKVLDLKVAEKISEVFNISITKIMKNENP